MTRKKKQNGGGERRPTHLKSVPAVASVIPPTPQNFPLARAETADAALSAQPETAIAVVEPKKPAFHLALSDNGASPVVRMRVCLTPETLTELQKYQVLFPFLLLIYGPWDEEENRFKLDKHDHPIERRKIVRVDRGIVQITFDRPGPHKIFAAIVWSSDAEETSSYEHRQHLEKRYLKANYGYWDRKLIISGSADLDFFWNAVQYIDVHTINIDRNMFAPEPSPKMKEWASMFLGSPPEDQCDWRRRIIFSFTLQPPILLVYAVAMFVWIIVKWAVFGSLIAIISFLFSKRLYPSVMRMPLDGYLTDFAPFFGSSNMVDTDSKHDWLQTRRIDKGMNWRSFEDRRSPRLLWLKPWRLIALACTGFLANKLLAHSTAVGIKFNWSAVAILGVGLLMLAVLLGRLWRLREKTDTEDHNAMLAKAKKLAAEREAAEAKRLAAERKARLDAFYGTHLSPLVCAVPTGADAGTGMARVESTRVKDLPKTHQTYALRFEEFKSEVCKPFSKG